MAIPFTCPHCGKSTVVDDRFAGQQGPCAACGKTITVPSPGAFGTPPPKGGSGTGIGLILGILAAVVVGGGCVIAILVALLLPAVGAARGAARRASSSNNLMQIGLALHNYHDTYGAFPPAYVTDATGKPLYSWRVLILPYLEQQGIYTQFNKDKAWDAPENIAMSNMAIQTFRSPSDDAAAPNGASYFVIVGPNTVFPGDKSTKLMEISDGTSNTIAVIETKGIAGSWAAPIDPKIENISLRIGTAANEIQPVQQGGTQALLSDGSVRFLSQTTDPETLRRLIIRDDGMPIGDF